jgi:23S rRNA (guanosine2251-2'-O)-methyltransferase
VTGRDRTRGRPWRRPPPAPEEEATERLIVGLQPAREALRAHGDGVLRVLVLKDNPRCQKFAEFARDNGVRDVRAVGQGELDRLTHNARHQGVALFAPTLQLAIWDDVLLSPTLLAVALDKISDPQNFGAIIRSAVGLAGAAVLWGEHASAPLTPATFRASAGAVEHATLCRVPSLGSALDLALSAGVQLVGLEAQAERLLCEIDLTGPTVLVMGAEDRGLSPAVRKRCTQLARLPMSRTLGSLNVSAATAIALYEAASQRARRA